MGDSDCCYRQEFEEGTGQAVERKRQCSKNDGKSIQINFDKIIEDNRNRNKKKCWTNELTQELWLAIILGVHDEECNLDQASQEVDKEKLKFEYVHLQAFVAITDCQKELIDSGPLGS
ncbi:hypothetical protein NPIL_480181 [Nephila pilipes]|uniref:Uncharacterized protein n=1 Tax=Nephila pilipes TaxID=299642 RepID=A0A8X6QH86_NEPPI|nr:hypothetical protein NPIL_480181 [Nephila pilipes]